MPFLHGAGAHELLLARVLNSEVLTTHVLDGRTGDRVATLDGPNALAAMTERLRAAQRTTTPLRAANGRRVWFLNQVLECDGRDGAVERLPWHQDDVAQFQHGFGFRFHRRGQPMGHSFYDLTRTRVFTLDGAELGLGNGPQIRAGEWVIGSVGSGWSLFDPERRTRRPLAGVTKTDCVGPVLDDGRMLAIVGGELTMLDPESGERTVLLLPAGCKPTRVADAGVHQLRTPSGQRLFLLMGDQDPWLGRLEPDAKRVAITRLPQSAQVLGAADEESAVIVRTNEVVLERLFFDGRAPQRLFPVASR
jgi:hypothetical protein